LAACSLICIRILWTFNIKLLSTLISRYYSLGILWRNAWHYCMVWFAFSRWMPSWMRIKWWTTLTWCKEQARENKSESSRIIICNFSSFKWNTITLSGSFRSSNKDSKMNMQIDCVIIFFIYCIVYSWYSSFILILLCFQHQMRWLSPLKKHSLRLPHLKVSTNLLETAKSCVIKLRFTLHS